VVVYEVNLEVERRVAADFERWLASHIEEMLSLPGFFRARWYVARDLAAPSSAEAGSDTVCWIVQYDLYTEADLERYLREDAPRMRGDGLERFAGRFESWRRVLEPRSLGAPPPQDEGEEAPGGS